jgi:putative transposase
LLWIAIEFKIKGPSNKNIQRVKYVFVVERLLSNVMESYGGQPVSTDGGTWHPQSCPFLKRIIICISQFEKILWKGLDKHIKDTTGCFDDYFPCKKKNANYFILKIELNYL